MDCSTPGFPVHHQLLELAQTHVYWVGDSIQPSHPLSSPSPLAFNLSQHQGLFQWVSSLHQVAKVLELQHQFNSVQFSRSVISNSSQPLGLQHARLSCPSPTLGAYSNSCPSSQWCHPTISSSVVPFSSHLQSFPATGSFLVNQFFTSGGQSIGVSASSQYSGLISFTIDWFHLLAVQGTLKSLCQHQSWKASILQHSAFFKVQLSHPYMTTGKTIALTRQTFVGNIISLLFNMLSRLVIAFPPRSKHLFISWLQSPSAMLWRPSK